MGLKTITFVFYVINKKKKTVNSLLVAIPFFKVTHEWIQND